MTQAALLGLTPGDVYAMTLRELFYYAEGVTELRRTQRNGRIEQAYLTAKLPRFKRMPKLADLQVTKASNMSFGAKLKAMAPIIALKFGAVTKVHKKSKGKKK